MDGSTRGRLLVATPDLRDPNFERTVVLVLEHNDDGALGVVLNRPSASDVEQVFPDWAHVVVDPTVVFAGGPVATDSVIALARGDRDDSVDGWVSVLGTIGTVDLGRDPVDLDVAIDSVRVFAGYAGWAPGQLDAELETGGWWVFDAEPDDAFSVDPLDLWAAVVRRQGGRVAWFVNCPPDPSVN
jgi:putative transcriptional regulator